MGAFFAWSPCTHVRHGKHGRLAVTTTACPGAGLVKAITEESANFAASYRLG